jgi:hypothetical protein
MRGRNAHTNGDEETQQHKGNDTRSHKQGAPDKDHTVINFDVKLLLTK